ncbi:hypothetical protein WMY93_001264 [Mugilogobius chulae]|uniref:L1 transposable element RRM domain-containing protein n=1 Tax=Mugilogobius chulae TaxID=88201 RepID=A0AAW0Q367_9GOBI
MDQASVNPRVRRAWGAAGPRSPLQREHTLANIEQAVSTLSEQVQEMETRIGANEDNVTDALARISKMEKEIVFLREKSDDLENRSRRSNVRLINVPEKAEGNNMVIYIERLIPRLFGQEHFPTPVTIERAHRLGRYADRTRPVVVKFLNYKDKEKVLRLAREKGPLFIDEQRISFYPDYSVELQRKITGYREVKKKLREKNIEYANRYPAKLRIRHQSTYHLFSTPTEVEGFLSSLDE